MPNIGDDDLIDTKDVSPGNFKKVRKRMGRTNDPRRRQALANVLGEMKNNRNERAAMTQALQEQKESFDKCSEKVDGIKKTMDDIKGSMDIDKPPETMNDAFQKMAVLDSKKYQLRQHAAQLKKVDNEKARAERARQIVQAREDAKAAKENAKADEAQRRQNAKDEKKKKRKRDETSETAASSKRLATGENDVEEPKETASSTAASSTELAPTNSGENDVETPEETASSTSKETASSTNLSSISGEDDAEKPQETASFTRLAPISDPMIRLRRREQEAFYPLLSAINPFSKGTTAPSASDGAQ
jgi:hypothetical protein